MDYLLLIRRYAPFATFGGGFEGDNRKAGTNSQYATSRTIGMVLFNLQGKVYTYGHSSGTEFHGFGTWASELVGTHYSRVKSTLTSIIQGNQSLSFSVKTEGANPLVPVAAPDIDTFLDFTIKFRESEIEVRGVVRGDSFPNAEVILVDSGPQCAEDMSSLLLFDYRTSGGRNTGPLTSLWGANASQVLGEFKHSIPHNNGKFIGCTRTAVVKAK